MDAERIGEHLLEQARGAALRFAESAEAIRPSGKSGADEGALDQGRRQAFTAADRPPAR